MTATRERIIITGASGVIGRHFLNFAKDSYYIFAIARRSQKDAEIPDHPNIKWIQVDVGQYALLKSALDNMIGRQKVHFVLHLASYYDYNTEDHPEYERTNVTGTRNVLKYARQLNLKRFIFLSSLAAFKFPSEGVSLNEKADDFDDYPYAWSKKMGEDLVRRYSEFFPCTIIRSAAVYSDWCEYGLLYVFLTRWLSGQRTARILAGSGACAIPFIHASDLNRLLLKILKVSHQLPVLDTYIASPDKSASNLDLFLAATRYFYGEEPKPICLPRWLLAPLLILRHTVRRILRMESLERPWMMKYVDKKLVVDASYTREQLGWQVTPRFDILRRLLFLVEKIKTSPDEWHFKNTRILQRYPRRSNMVIYEVMVKIKEKVVQQIRYILLDKTRRKEFSQYQKINRETLDLDIYVFYQFLTASVRNKDRFLLVNYAANILAPIRLKAGFSVREVCGAILNAGEIVVSSLKQEPELSGMETTIHDQIILTIQMAVDEVQNAFESLGKKKHLSIPDRKIVEDKLNELAAFCIEPKED